MQRQLKPYRSFLDSIAASEEQVFSKLYQHIKPSISVKNHKIAIKKLAIIFKATFKLANKIGFQSMSLRALASETGLSMGGLYAYIQSKEQLAEFIYQFLDHYGSWVFEQFKQDHLDPLQQLQNFILIHVYLSEWLQPWFYFAFMESKNLSEKQLKTAIDTEMSTDHKIMEILQRGQKESQFIQKNPELLAALIKSMLQDWYLKRSKYQHKSISVDTFAAEVFQLTCSILLSPNNQELNIE